LISILRQKKNLRKLKLFHNAKIESSKKSSKRKSKKPSRYYNSTQPQNIIFQKKIPHMYKNRPIYYLLPRGHQKSIKLTILYNESEHNKCPWQPWPKKRLDETQKM
jgi:hypothetical protein